MPNKNELSKQEFLHKVGRADKADRNLLMYLWLSIGALIVASVVTISVLEFAPVVAWFHSIALLIIWILPITAIAKALLVLNRLIQNNDGAALRQKALDSYADDLPDNPDYTPKDDSED